MQRWIAAGVVAMLIFCGGAFVAFKTYKQNRPAPVWVPLPINPELPTKKRDEVIKNLKEKLSDRGLLKQVSRDVKAASKWGFASDTQAAEEIADRLFVKAGDADTPMGKVPAILIGMNGKVKDRDLCGEIAVRMMQDVWGILGVDPPKKPIDDE
jgi:ribosomal protein L39E